MKHDKYRYSNTEEIVWYLKKYRRVNEEWQADFYDEYGRHMLTFESPRKFPRQLRFKGQHSTKKKQ